MCNRGDCICNVFSRPCLLNGGHANKRQLHELQEKHGALLKQMAPSAGAQCLISDRAEATYLNIIGSMLDLMLGQSPSGVPYSGV